MSEVKAGLYYTEDHEWIEKLENGNLRLGITDFAQHQLGDIVFVELPEEGAAVEAEASIGSIESVKTVSDLFCPVGGKIVAVNGALEGEPELVNSAPYGGGWMIEIQPDDAAEGLLAGLLTPEKYERHQED
ncbi:glycine cleavage system protein GcvH [Saccharibacillus sp. CPCC 101409]|uniref:glycine cleavage system protein GcvH n=1 Tax=Saccharibacillus sp. CPCC 101409 TaxID=3058041 RepID=UPI002673D326|nr:glycine cleavage system protein GcvH [Saccharibacillus sp. CPCC 101409]MDO3409065.1 glycine cleavage system protein GcvH [Saccharibacillus sp. CPCC 101409]